MHDQPLNQQELSPEATEYLDQQIVRALETQPQVAVPTDFASRVASRLPAKRPVSVTSTYYGQGAMLIGILLTLAALLVMSLYPTGPARFGLLESILFAPVRWTRRLAERPTAQPALTECQLKIASSVQHKASATKAVLRYTHGGSSVTLGIRRIFAGETSSRTHEDTKGSSRPRSGRFGSSCSDICRSATWRLQRLRIPHQTQRRSSSTPWSPNCTARWARSATRPPTLPSSLSPTSSAMRSRIRTASRCRPSSALSSTRPRIAAALPTCRSAWVRLLKTILTATIATAP